MQAAISFAPSALSPVKPINNLGSTMRSVPKLPSYSRCYPIRASANDTTTVDYSSSTSVFPAEARETIGGEASGADVYPEVKLKPEAKSTTPKTASEPVDREYIEYDSPKTVFPAEACDDLGGEFCQPDYQRGVF